MIRVFDAFSGIGGFRSALERVGGFKFVAWCEIDKFAQKAYRALYDTGGEQFYENIRNIDTGELADFDLLVGGFPCQPFSVCGARKGFADERGDLFFELARILESKRPRYFLLENIPGLMGIDSGRTFAKIIETLCELGYCVEWRVYNSADYLPQVRKRVYIAGCLGINCSGKILAVGRSDCQNSRKTEQLIGGSQGSRVYDSNGLAATQCSGSGGMGGKTGLYFIDCNPDPQMTDIARCVTARQNSGVSNHKGEHSAVFCDLNENPQITDAARCLHTRMDQGVTGTHRGERLFGISAENCYTNVRFGLFAAEEITAADGSSIPEDGLIAEVSLDENMKAVIAEKVPFAKYYVQEIATDEHYILNGEKYLVSFEYQGESSIIN